MRIHLLAVGNRMPAWVEEGYAEYAKRLPPECALVLKEIAPEPRTKNARPERLREMEGARLLAALPRAAVVVALEVGGRPWSTEDLATRLAGWLAGGRDVALMVGGPDGLSDACRAAASMQWSLSSLTLPHPLVRVIVAEQVYRAWSLLRGHPYHRA